MRMVAPVVGCSGIGKHLVVNGVVVVDVVTCGRCDHGWIHTQIAQQGGYGDVHDIIAETPSVRPSPGNSTRSKARLNFACEYVVPKNAQAGEAGIIGRGGVVGAASGKPGSIRGKINHDHVGNEN